MMNANELKDKCEEIFNIQNHTLGKIEVTINSRLTRTLGRCMYKREAGHVIPTKIEFSKLLLETASPADIDAVIKHECSHALVTLETGESHGHDSAFKKMCARVGTSNDECSMSLDLDDESKFYKYFVVCRKCGQTVGKYHRASKVVKNPDWYHCKCGGDLEVCTSADFKEKN